MVDLATLTDAEKTYLRDVVETFSQAEIAEFAEIGAVRRIHHHPWLARRQVTVSPWVGQMGEG